MAKNDYLRTSSLDVEGNLNFRDLDVKKRYNDWLLGVAKKEDLGHDQVLGFPATSRPPSWTQAHTGRNQAFVIKIVSGSFTESLNTYDSGSTALETTAVPASASQHYSKKETFTITYKVTGSDVLAAEGAPWGSHDVTLGTLIEKSNTNFGIVSFNVAEYGRISNIRVWLEMVEPSSSSGVATGAVSVAIVAPNNKSQFFSGVPFFNTEPIRPRIQNWVDENNPAGSFRFGQKYILQHRDQLDNVWQFDRGIRTVFDDAANFRNPAHVDPILASGSFTEPKDSYLLALGSPSHTVASVSDPDGFFISWTSDVTASPFMGEGAAGSPPDGWLTGPGGTNDVNEWPTTGSNYGPETIRPFYPMLDDIVEVKVDANDPEVSIVGFRPGLRGVEAHGEWQLFLDTNGAVGTAGTTVAYFRQARLELTLEKNRQHSERRSDHLFRRRNIKRKRGRTHWSYHSGSWFFNVGGGEFVITDYERFSTVYIVDRQGDYGQTVGITKDTGSFGDFAVFSRLTGTLADRLAGSYTGWYLNNDFGTPFIPLSSGSGADPTFDLEIDVAEIKKAMAEVLEPKKDITPTNTLRHALTRFPVTRTTRDSVRVAVLNITGSS